jgi:uncharacterized protein YeaO (DUF488 family)
MIIETRRIYDSPRGHEGFRVLIDRLWPRGLSKDDVRIDEWFKDLAPSDRLRRWFGHDPERWEEFKERYFAELDGKADLLGRLLAKAKGRAIVLLYGARDKRYNQATALKEYLERTEVVVNTGGVSA